MFCLLGRAHAAHAGGPWLAAVAETVAPARILATDDTKCNVAALTNLWVFPGSVKQHLRLCFADGRVYSFKCTDDDNDGDYDDNLKEDDGLYLSIRRLSEFFFSPKKKIC